MMEKGWVVTGISKWRWMHRGDRRRRESFMPVRVAHSNAAELATPHEGVLVGCLGRRKHAKHGPPGLSHLTERPP